MEEADFAYIIRDHSREKFEKKKEFIEKAAAFINEKYGAGTVTLTVKDQYYNMREQVPKRKPIAKSFKTRPIQINRLPALRAQKKNCFFF